MFKKISLYTLYYITLFTIIYCLFIGYGLWEGLIRYMAMSLRKYNAYGYLLYSLIDIIYTTLPLVIVAILYRRKYLNKPIQKRDINIALLIPCHKAESIIENTLKDALRIFTPQSIYVIDNGNSDKPFDNTQNICENLGVNYVWSNIGSKITSIYIGARLAKNFSHVMQIDDDISLEKDMTFPIDESIDCIAYTISGISKNKNDSNILQKCQDVEYKIAGIIKGIQTWLGNANFAHGAISLWKRESLIKVLENHPMYPISDDWFTGYIANVYGMRIEVCDQKFISTDTPRTLFWGGRTSGYGNCTLWQQRFIRWYALIGLQTIYNLYYIFFVWKFSIRRVIFQKLFILFHSVIMTIIIFRYVIFAYSIYLSVLFPMIMFASRLVLWIINFIMLNFLFLQKEERFDLLILFIFPLYYMIDSVACIASILYGIFYKIPRVLIEDRINLKDNEKIKIILEKYEERKFLK
jgi:hypothetical protein